MHPLRSGMLPYFLFYCYLIFYYCYFTFSYIVFANFTLRDTAYIFALIAFINNPSVAADYFSSSTEAQS